MTSTKYIGMDVHKESISIAVMNDARKIVMECVIETKANDSTVCRWAARRLARHVRRRNLGRLVVRLAETTVLHRFVDQGHPAGDGASNLGQEDCHHRVDGVEERSVLRTQLIKDSDGSNL
jgi:hypothetical protein